MILTDIIILIFISLVSACATQFLYFCLGEPSGSVKEGRIFSYFGYLINRKYNTIEARFKIAQEKISDPIKRKQLRHKQINWMKPLGICPVCTNPYLTALFFVGLNLVFSHVYGYALSYWFLLPCLFVSNTIFRKIW